MTRAYLRARMGVIALFGALFLIVCAVGALYALPPEPVCYALALSAALLLCAAAIDGYYFAKRRRLLRALLLSVTVSTDGLPEPVSAPEADYQALIGVLSRELKRVEQRHAAMRSEMMDYYTLWVHQAKTPIAAMRLLLEQGGAPDVAALGAELFKIEEYVSMALNYMRMESDAADLVIRRVELDDIIRRAARKYARLFIAKKLQLDVMPMERQVLTDEKWLLFAVEQLMSNAVKYTREGGVRVYEDGRALVIEDTGIGIPPEDLPRVFERGYTGVSGRTDRNSSGIGLYMTRRALTMLRHTIRVESEVGVGTRMIIGLEREQIEFE